MELKTEEYYNSLDKRSKEYKEYASSLIQDKPSEGLGDTIEKIMDKTGVKSIVKAVFGEDCGCDERKIALNKLFKYRTECLLESEYEFLDTLFARLGSKLSSNDQKLILPIFNRVFNTNKKPSSCTTCWIAIVNQLRIIHGEYKKELS